MRLRLFGYSGERPPVPGTEPVNPVDPPPTPDPVPDVIPPPLVVRFDADGEFRKADYLALGYNRFDVMCIGGAGGRGGGMKQTVPDSAPQNQIWEGVGNPHPHLYFNSYAWTFGGGGGGGGVHRIKGRLALLPTVCEVKVGRAGADGSYGEHTNDFRDYIDANGYVTTMYPPLYGGFTAGEDGGESSFGTTVCRASGGKSGSHGGAGGIGNRGGAGGGQSLTGMPGAWDGKVGSGGPGGLQRDIFAYSGQYPSSQQWPISFLMHSAYNPSPPGGGGDPIYGPGNVGVSTNLVDGAPGAVSSADPSTKSDGELALPFGFDFNLIQSEVVNNVGTGRNIIVPSHRDYPKIIPGAGGGAKPFLLNGENVPYGTRANGRDGNGLVVVRLTYAIV